ncbi:MAG: carboxypeptidase-like regulatory domain-containing protein [Candidatus Eremiobacter antarcticus]
MKRPSPSSRSLVAAAVAGAALLLSGCPNPNAIGVQQYGTIMATCRSTTNNAPVADALVSAGGVVARSGANGVATLTNVPIGQEVVTADAPGLHGVTSVTVTENQTFNVTIQLSPT